MKFFLLLFIYLTSKIFLIVANAEAYDENAVDITCDCFGEKTLTDEKGCREFLKCQDPECREPGTSSAKLAKLLEKVGCDEYEICWAGLAFGLQTELTEAEIEEKMKTSCLTQHKNSNCADEPSARECISDAVLFEQKCIDEEIKKCKKGERFLGYLIENKNVESNNGKIEIKSDIQSMITSSNVMDYVQYAFGLIAPALIL